MASSFTHDAPSNATAGPGPSSSRANTPSHTTAAQSTDPPPKPELPWAFHDCPIDTLVVLISHMLDLLMQHNDQVQLTPDALTRFHSRAAPGISVLDYLRRIVKYTNMEQIPLLSLLAYIDLTCANLPTFTLSTLTVHRFLIAGVCAGSKAQCDVFCTNAHYAKVGGIKVQELNALEREFLRVTQWALCCNADLLQRYYTSLIRSHGGFTQLTAPHRSPFRAFPRSLSKPRSRDNDKAMEQDEEQGPEGRDVDGGEGSDDAGEAEDEDHDMDGDGEDASTTGSGSASGSNQSSRAPSRPRSPDDSIEAAPAGDDRGRKARRRSVEEVLGVSAEVTGSGNAVGLRDVSPRRERSTGQGQQGREDVDMEEPGREKRSAGGPLQEQNGQTCGHGSALRVDPATSSSASSAPLAIPNPHHRSSLSSTAAPTVTREQAYGSTSRTGSSPNSSAPASSRSSTRLSSLRRGSTASAASTMSRRSGRSSVGAAGVLGTSSGKTPSLSMSVGSAGRPAEAVLDTRHGRGGEGVRTPDVLGSRRGEVGSGLGGNGDGGAAREGQIEDRVEGLRNTESAAPVETAVGNVHVPASDVTHDPAPTLESAAASEPSPLSSHVDPSAKANTHGRTHLHPHIPSGGKLLKNLVGVFKKRPAHPHVSPAGSPERDRIAREVDFTSNTGSTDPATTAPALHAHAQAAFERPAKSPRIHQSHTSPNVSAHIPHIPTSSTSTSAPSSTLTGVTRMSPRMLNGVNVNVNLNMSPSMSAARATSSRSPIMAHTSRPHARQAGSRTRTRSTSTTGTRKSKSKSRSPRNSPFLASAPPGRSSGQVGYGVRREGDGGLAV